MGWASLRRSRCRAAVVSGRRSGRASGPDVMPGGTAGSDRAARAGVLSGLWCRAGQSVRSGGRAAAGARPAGDRGHGDRASAGQAAVWMRDSELCRCSRWGWMRRCSTGRTPPRSWSTCMVGSSCPRTVHRQGPGEPFGTPISAGTVAAMAARAAIALTTPGGFCGQVCARLTDAPCDNLDRGVPPGHQPHRGAGQSRRTGRMGAWTLAVEAVHHVRDRTMDEDRHTIRTKNAALNWAIVRDTSIGALRLAGNTSIAKARLRPTATPDLSFRSSLRPAETDFDGAL
jgi:hypothetical protein